MDHATPNKFVSFIGSIADDCLRDFFVRGKYRDVILPMFVLRRIDCLLEETKEAVLTEVKFQKTVAQGFFPAQVVAESMNRRIPNGSRCLFREPSEGLRNGKVVIVQSRDIQDPDTGGQYTVKIYRSEKAETEDCWSHRSIGLEPDSMDFNFKPLSGAVARWLEGRVHRKLRRLENTTLWPEKDF